MGANTSLSPKTALGSCYPKNPYGIYIKSLKVSIYFGLNVLLLGIYSKEIIKQECKSVCSSVSIKPMWV